MRLLTVVSFLVISVVAGDHALPSVLTEYKEGQRYFLFPDGENKLHLVDSEQTETGRASRFNADKDIVLRLFTQKNPLTANFIVNGNLASLLSSTFNKKNPVKIIIHGWNSSGTSKINLLLTKSYLDILDVNVICLDWKKGANVLYPTSIKNMVKVSAYLTTLLDWLAEQGVPLSNIHIMGHSLGPHIAGLAARDATKGRVGMITAFDAALPMVDAELRLTKWDAEYVEVIHTSAGNLGITEAIGHNDFYPNGGSSQPGCGINIGCSHSRSYEYFAASLDHTGFMANQCKSVKEATSEKCSNVSKLHMGGASAKPAVGIFHLKTDKNPPYYRG